jgi:hypothetical protein
MRYRGQSQRFPDTVHFFEVTDDGAVIFLPVFFVEEDSQKLVLGIISP